MTTILVNGTVGSDKTGLVEENNELLRKAGLPLMESVSVGAELASIVANTRVNQQPATYPDMPDVYMDSLRIAALERVKNRILESTSDSRVIDTPLVLPNGHDVLTPAADFRMYLDLGLDKVVTVVDSPHAVKERLSSNPAQYFRKLQELASELAGKFSLPDIHTLPKGLVSDDSRTYLAKRITDQQAILEQQVYQSLYSQALLDWSAVEVIAAQAIADVHPGKQLPTLVLPREHSESNLAKLAIDNQAPIIYLAFPITNLGEERELMLEKIGEFRTDLQQYGVVVSPLVIADEEKGQVAFRHTVHRDIGWFVRQADLVVAYFPGDFSSSGVQTEMSHQRPFGGQAIFVKDYEESKIGRSPFEGLAQRTFSGKTAYGDFFSAVLDGEIPLHNGKSLIHEKGMPRYHELLATE